jgi:hypothetical protein
MPIEEAGGYVAWPLPLRFAFSAPGFRKNYRLAAFQKKCYRRAVGCRRGPKTKVGAPASPVMSLVRLVRIDQIGLLVGANASSCSMAKRLVVSGGREELTTKAATSIVVKQ